MHKWGHFFFATGISVLAVVASVLWQHDPAETPTVTPDPDTIPLDPRALAVSTGRIAADTASVTTPDIVLMPSETEKMLLERK
jgi:hypothetical protein